MTSVMRSSSLATVAKVGRRIFIYALIPAALVGSMVYGLVNRRNNKDEEED